LSDCNDAQQRVYDGLEVEIRASLSDGQPPTLDIGLHLLIRAHLRRNRGIEQKEQSRLLIFAWLDVNKSARLILRLCGTARTPAFSGYQKTSAKPVKLIFFHIIASYFYQFAALRYGCFVDQPIHCCASILMHYL